MRLKLIHNIKSVENLIGTTIIVDNLKHANELARAIQYKTRIVTLEEIC